MTIKIKPERTASEFSLDIEGLSGGEIQKLRDYGLEEIKKDDRALINYGFTKYMDEFINKLGQNVKALNRGRKKLVDI